MKNQSFTSKCYSLRQFTKDNRIEFLHLSIINHCRTKWKSYVTRIAKAKLDISGARERHPRESRYRYKILDNIPA